MSFYIFVLLFCSPASYGQFLQKKPLTLVAQKLECESDSTFVTNMACGMVKLETGGASLNLTGTLVKDLNQFWLRHQNYIGIGKGNYKMGFIGATLDLCDLNKAIKGTILNQFLNESLRHLSSGMIHTCPYLKNEVLRMENVLFQGSFYLQILRPGSYRFDYRLYNGDNHTIAYLKYYAAVTYQK